MFTKEESRKFIKELTESFIEKLEYIKRSGQYKEANVEDEFIKPLFKYLNWNVTSEGISNPNDREFIVQAKGRGNKEPDYLLQLDSKPHFYMEAKHPKYDLSKEIGYLWQVYSYAYSTQTLAESRRVDFAVLTDFEEFKLIDCTFKASPETVSNFICLDWKCTDFIEKFDTLWQTFEKENIRSGSLTKYRLNEKKIRQNRISPDAAFLEDLDDPNTGWRIRVAKDIKKNNPDISTKDLTLFVQKLIDRLIFIKILSDREIEDDYLAQIFEKIRESKKSSSTTTVNKLFSSLFSQLNATYNGAVFEEIKIFDSIVIGNDTLHSIVGDFLPKNSRYNFSVIPVEILGTIYERFLGKVIVTTEKRAKIEIDEKEEVKKTGGVFYTPKYIVDTINHWTFGERLEKCTNIEQLLEISVCDPSCGSGSFLLSAFGMLIERAKIIIARMDSRSKKFKEIAYYDSDKHIKLRSKLKCEILTNCIYGVDIDEQAVEVTKMSLCIKAIEDTKREELYQEVNLFHEKVLPELNGNIITGNSLVDANYYDSQLDVGIKESNPVAVFPWKLKFKTVFQNGGFDAIVGNPPYVRIQTTNANAINYFSGSYTSATGNYDLYCLFVEKGFELLKENGRFGYILPHRFFKTEYGTGLRKYISEHSCVAEIVDFDGFMIFATASINTCLLLMEKSNDSSSEFNYHQIKTHRTKSFEVASSINDLLFSNESSALFYSNKIRTSHLTQNPWVFISKESEKTWEKLTSINTQLKDVTTEIFQGLKTGADSVFILELLEKGEHFTKVKSKALKDEGIFELENSLLFPLAKSENFKRWEITKENRVIIFPYDEYGSLISQKQMKSAFPKIWEYLSNKKCKEILESRDRDGWRNQNWYGYSRSQALINIRKPKLLTPDYYEYPCFCPDYEGKAFFTGGGAGGYGLVIKDNIDQNYILGLLNSKLFQWYISKTSLRAYQNAFMFVKKYIQGFPVKIPNASAQTAVSNLVVAIIQRKNSPKKQAIDEIEIFEQKINEIIFDVYGFTKFDIDLIAGQLG